MTPEYAPVSVEIHTNTHTHTHTHTRTHTHAHTHTNTHKHTQTHKKAIYYMNLAVNDPKIYTFPTHKRAI